MFVAILSISFILSLATLETNTFKHKKPLYIINTKLPESADAFADALDAPSLVFHSHTTKYWFVSHNSPYQGGSCVQSAPIGNSEATSFNLTIIGPVNISFYWKVSSENNYDFLNFIVNGVIISRISGEVGWTKYSYSFPNSGQYMLKWEYRKDRSGFLGSDCGWVDYIQFSNISTTSISTILDSNLMFTEDAQNPWVLDFNSKMGNSSLKAQTSAGRSKALKTSITQKGVLTWWWKTSSSSASFSLLEESSNDNMTVMQYRNGTNWEFAKYAITETDNSYHFTFTPTSSADYGLLDGVIFTPCDPIHNIYVVALGSGIERGESVSVRWYGADGKIVSIYLITSTQNITLSTTEYSESFGGEFSFTISNSFELGKARILIMQKDLPINSFYSVEFEISMSTAWITLVIIGAIIVAAIAGVIIINNNRKLTRADPNLSPINMNGVQGTSGSLSSSLSSMIRSAFSRDMIMPKAISVRFTKSTKDLQGSGVRAVSVRWKKDQ